MDVPLNPTEIPLKFHRHHLEIPKKYHGTTIDISWNCDANPSAPHKGEDARRIEQSKRQKL